jgi:hypothetical protein
MSDDCLASTANALNAWPECYGGNTWPDLIRRRVVLCVDGRAFNGNTWPDPIARITLPLKEPRT